MFNLTKIVCLIICGFIHSNIINAHILIKPSETQEHSNDQFLMSFKQTDHSVNVQDNYKEEGFKELLSSNKGALKNGIDSVPIYKNLAIINAELNNPQQAFKFTNKYINNSLDFSVLSNDSFNRIIGSKEYELLKNKYMVRIDFFSFTYSYIALIGLFFVVVFNLKTQDDKTGNLLMSGFVMVHVLFVIEYVLYTTNIQYSYPNSYLFSSAFALMYGPLLFFYFKRVTQGYVFKIQDFWHLLPTVILLVFVLTPVYFLDKSEKLKMMLGISDSFKNYWLFIFIPKLLSLIIYGVFIAKLHFKNTGRIDNTNVTAEIINWERNIYRIHVVYVFSYVIYGLSISGVLGESSEVIYNSHIASMSVMIAYIAYMAYAQPKLFHKEAFHILKSNSTLISKYEKSGLTDSFSKELSESLFKLLIEDKIYKDSTISLESLSEKLQTSRHNTSQIINEHFNMNFFELINKFRIQEAVEILQSDLFGNLHIIDVAYEVGFNNKVTFNKAFKKQTALTPSEFLNKRLNTSQVN